ncbi:hypothetical protein RFI_34463 [Reticulomyxa filosa]|uniref:Uncharacterized protein n=1 Tax=Reticulomyxa filosa TaxID=46433 RepID=X6LP90_RETFI|nr:hypothetical protein RFI_34463 [Reticulomyxa filosa]|eukprot:ETO02947.1 hypothetical protein RFI_34463 [Reticulomyxa filosa]
MKLHFDLVIKSFDTLQQTIRQYQEEIKKLNLENETLKVELQLKSKKDEDCTFEKTIGAISKRQSTIKLCSGLLYFPFCFHLIQKYQKQTIIIKQKTIFVEMEKLKKISNQKTMKFKK